MKKLPQESIVKIVTVPLTVVMLFVSGYFALWITGTRISTSAVQIINWFILATIFAISVYFVGRDTRKRGFPWLETIFWIIISVATFPIGFGLYFLMRGRTL